MARDTPNDERRSGDQAEEIPPVQSPDRFDPGNRRRDFFRGGDGDYGEVDRPAPPRPPRADRGQFRGRRGGDQYAGKRRFGWRGNTRSDWSRDAEPKAAGPREDLWEDFRRGR